jgi:uncharacterized protein (TIGR03435 family)
MDFGLDSDAAVYSAAASINALGLKLEPTNHTFDIVVIDHIERVPTGN